MCFFIFFLRVARPSEKGFRRPRRIKSGNAVAFAVSTHGFEETAELGIVLQQREQVVQIGNGNDGQAVLFFHFLNGG